jgi:hypothetical protein
LVHLGEQQTRQGKVDDEEREGLGHFAGKQLATDKCEAYRRGYRNPYKRLQSCRIVTMNQEQPSQLTRTAKPSGREEGTHLDGQPNELAHARTSHQRRRRSLSKHEQILYELRGRSSERSKGKLRTRRLRRQGSAIAELQSQRLLKRSSLWLVSLRWRGTEGRGARGKGFELQRCVCGNPVHTLLSQASPPG